MRSSGSPRSASGRIQIRFRFTAVAAGTAVIAGLVTPAAQARPVATARPVHTVQPVATVQPVPRPIPAVRPVLTNLAHLDFLTDRVAPPSQPGHTTYHLTQESKIGVLWVYADRQTDGSFRRVGGGDFDAATNTYSQGAYDTDDLTRAAVVYLRHWRQFGDAHSRRQAYQLLRGVTYLQTASGPNAGNPVLWMQPDGTLNPSPTPVELPNPSDSGQSYWLARTIWALGEGYADFRAGDRADRKFAAFLHRRMELSIAALNREVLVRYGRYQIVDGVARPAWLIVDGADASSEAVLGLSAYVRAGGGPRARTALRQLARGISKLSGGGRNRWPYGALLPSATTNSSWHAWAAQMTSALVGASVALHDRRLIASARRDAAGFTPDLLASYGPVNGLLPAPVDRTVIAYGVDARLQGLLAVARAIHSTGVRALAGIDAGWYFGQNPAAQPTYDPATGVTADGVSSDGVVNPNSGAESTIHGLLSMLALDAHPAVSRAARRAATIVSRDGQRVVEAETATLGAGASVVTPDPSGTAESTWSGGRYVTVPAGSTVTWTMPATTQPLIVEPIVNRVTGAGGRTVWTAGGQNLGSLSTGGLGAQGVSAAPGQLVPLTLDRLLPPGSSQLLAQVSRGPVDLDAVLLTPVVARLVLTGTGQTTTLFASRARASATETAPGGRTAIICTGSGRCVSVTLGQSARVLIPGGGFAIVRS